MLLHVNVIILIVLFGCLTFCICDGTTQPAITFITPEQVKNISETVELNCTVTNAEGYTVQWHKKRRDRPNEHILIAFNGVRVPNDPRLKSIFDNTTGTYSLIISDIHASDSATYECRISMTIDEQKSMDVELFVRHPPVISENSTTLTTTVTERKSVTLICTANGYPRPEITWKRQNNALMPDGSSTVSGNNFTIPIIRKGDRGLYNCIANNGIGNPDVKIIDLKVEFAPVISVYRPKVVQALNYDTVLECDVIGYPAPGITWLKNDVKVEANEHYHISNIGVSVNDLTKSTLKITSVQNEHYSSYHCRATNKLGFAQARLDFSESKIPDINYPGLLLNTSTASTSKTSSSTSTLTYTIIIQQLMALLALLYLF